MCVTLDAYVEAPCGGVARWLRCGYMVADQPSSREFTDLPAATAERTAQQLLNQDVWKLKRRHITPAELKITRRERPSRHLRDKLSDLCSRK